MLARSSERARGECATIVGKMCATWGARQNVRDAMDAFRSAAARRGAYAEQCEAAEAALQLLEPADTLLLEELQDSLQRLLTNVASSIKRRSLDARGPQKVVQKRLGSARSRAVRRLREARWDLADEPSTNRI